MRKGQRTPEETRRKQSESAKNSPKAKAARRALHKNRAIIEKARKSNTGKKRTEEQKARMSKAQKGHPVSESTREKMRKILKGRKNGPRTEETKRKISNALKGRPLSKEHRDKLSRSKIERILAGKIAGESQGVCGEFYSHKNKKKLHYRSKLELCWFQLLEKTGKVKRYHVEPCVIEYKYKGATRRYIPDLRVRYIDGTTELVEIKPEGAFFRKHPMNIAKWAAAEKWCRKRKIPTTFRVVGYEELV